MGDTSRNHTVDIWWKPLAQDNTWKPETKRPGTGLLRNIHCAHWTTCLLHYPTHALALNYRQHNYQKLRQRWKSDRCALQDINLYNLKHAYRARHHSNFTLVSPMGNTRHSPVCIPQVILRPIPSYTRVWVRLLPCQIGCPPFCHCVKASLVSSSRRCWNTCHSAKGLLVPSLHSFNLRFCP